MTPEATSNRRPIAVGDRMPDGIFTTMTAAGPAGLTARELFDGRRVMLFGIEGAFTPTCHDRHLPGILQEYDTIRARGVDAVACLAVNDVFVLDAWARERGAAGRVVMLADGNGTYARALGLDLDVTRWGMGIRLNRCSMIVENGVVTALNIEAPDEYRVSGAEHLLCRLPEPS
jgi:peroxiredoxin